MKIIDIGVCIDNLDPKHLGRIRCIKYSSYTGEMERALDYNAWDDKDLFTAIPFLPTNINFIPEIGQTVKLLSYNTEKEFTNVEYVAGPFTTMHDYNSQTHSAQVENTTYGIAAKHGPNISKKDTDELIKNDGAFARHTDYGVYGKYGSDIIFTENGLMMRGGKLISKKGATIKQKTELVSQPILANKNSSLYLKKFDKNLQQVTDTIDTFEIESKPLKSIIEYDIKSFSGDSTTVDFYVYTINEAISSGKTFYGKNVYKTDNTNLADVLIISGLTKLNSLDGSTSGVTFSLNSSDERPPEVLIRDVFKTIHSKGTLSEVYNSYKKELTGGTLPIGDVDLHPFYFRPTKDCKEKQLSSGETANRIAKFSKVILATNVGPQNGLVFSVSSYTIPGKNKRVKNTYLKKGPDGLEQSFSALITDKIYMLSTEAKSPNFENKKPISFEKLNKYEIKQEEYLESIDPNTFSLVRGEVLLQVLYSMANLFASHVHLMETPLIQSDPNYIDLMTKISNLEADMLNSSIKIN